MDKNQHQDSIELKNFKVFSSNITSIRALAIIGIIIFHYGLSTFYNSSIDVNPLVTAFYRIGEFGVDIFTFLSGILLTINLIHKEESNHSWKEWYKKRIIKIYPMLIVATLLYVSFHSAYNRYFDLNRILLHMSALETVPINPNVWNFAQVHWYITLILSCYLLFPILYFLMKKNYKLMALLGLFIFVLYSLFANHYYINSKEIFANFFQKDLDMILSGAFTLRYFEFYFGMIIGFWIADNEKKKVKILCDNRLGLFSFIIFTILCITYISFQAYSYSFYDLGPILLLPLLALLFIIFCNYLFYKKPKINKILEIPGTISYEIFLTHFVIIFVFVILTIFEILFFITLPIIIMLSIAFAYPLHYLRVLIEKKQEYHKMILAFVCSLVLYAIILYLFNLEQSSFNLFSAILYCSILGTSFLIFYFNEIIEFFKLKLSATSYFKK